MNGDAFHESPCATFRSLDRRHRTRSAISLHQRAAAPAPQTDVSSQYDAGAECGVATKWCRPVGPAQYSMRPVPIQVAASTARPQPTSTARTVIITSNGGEVCCGAAVLMVLSDAHHRRGPMVLDNGCITQAIHNLKHSRVRRHDLVLFVRRVFGA